MDGMTGSGVVKSNGTDGGVAERKREFRRQMRRKLADFCSTADGGGHRRAERSAAAAAFLASGLYRDAGEIFAYVALDCEPDVAEVIRRGLADGKRAAVPKVLAADGRADAGRMEFFYVPPEADWEAQLLPGAFGIREPPDIWERADIGAAEQAAVLVPGLAFSADGARLGRGKGFYDRYFSPFRCRAPLEQQRAAFCGVCFSFQRAPDVPAEPHDLRMDWLLTEAGLERCASRGR